MPRPVFTIDEVFISGGQPTVTYNPRKSLHLEDNLRNYLNKGHQLLSVTGPTKCGKTVLCKAVFNKDNREVIWISGGEIGNENDLWSYILNKLGNPTCVSIEESKTNFKENEKGADIGLNSIVKGEVRGSRTSGEQIERRLIQSRELTPRMAAIQALRNAKYPLIIDDFHYIDSEIKPKIVRALKTAIFEGVPIILIAVPHRAFDVVRAEGEMAGRVINLNVPQWSAIELEDIPLRGFEALNVTISKEIIDAFIKECVGSPYLMQEFCLKLCEERGIRETLTNAVHVTKLRQDFFTNMILATGSKIPFNNIIQNSQLYVDDNRCRLKDGTDVFLCPAIMNAIANLCPKEKFTFYEIKSSLENILNGTLPEDSRILNRLAHIDDVADIELISNKVIDWDRGAAIMYITDPFFQFYLRWFQRNLPQNTTEDIA